MSHQQEAENERYANILAALKECIELGVSKASMATLRFETGIDPRDYIAIQDAVIAQLSGSIAATKKKTRTTNQKHDIDSWVHANE